MKLYNDTDTQKAARSARRQEYLNLKSLPYLDEEQNWRLKELQGLMIRDNKAAFLEDHFQVIKVP